MPSGRIGRIVRFSKHLGDCLASDFGKIGGPETLDRKVEASDKELKHGEYSNRGRWLL